MRYLEEMPESVSEGKPVELGGAASGELQGGEGRGETGVGWGYDGEESAGGDGWEGGCGEVMG